MALRVYSINESVVFRKTKEEWGGLSNMSAGFSVNVNDIIIRSAEHLYQSCRFPDFPDLQWSIISEPSPMKAKWISKANIKYTRDDWELVRFKIMQWVLEVKLSQNWNKFGALLLETGEKNIVEATPKDKIWGAVRHADNYIGVNALGRLLMFLREEFVKLDKYNRCVFPLPIPRFQLLGSDIGLVCNEADMRSLHEDMHYITLAEC